MNFTKDNVKKLKIISIAWGVICLLTMVEVFLTNTYQPKLMPEKINNISLLFAMPVIRFFSGFIVIIVILIPSYILLKNRTNSIRIIGIVFTGFLFSMLYNYVFIVFNSLIFYHPGSGHIIEVVLNTFQSDLHYGVTYYFFLILMLFSMDYYKEKTRALINKEKAEKELVRVRFSILKNQLQPHFLFNALNSVTAIMDERKQSAQEMLIDISSLLRKSLELDYSKEITIKEEINILNAYLNIEKNRFEHQIKVIESYDDNALSKNILPFILQPLVENAIKHGFTKGIEVLTIKISIKFTEDVLQIEVSNNGAKNIFIEKGVGLKNLNARLFSTYGDLFEFKLAQIDDWVVNQIKIHSK